MTEYQELLKAATENEAPENLSALGEWFTREGLQYWNGEYFDCDTKRLYPIHTEPDEFGDCELLGYEFR